MKRVQNIYLKMYRIAAFTFLFSLLLLLAGYGGSLAFYVLSSQWALPVRLSPNHQDVIKFIPEINNVKTSLYESQAQLDASLKTQKILNDKDRLLGLSEKEISADLNSQLVTKDVANFRRIELLDAKVKSLAVESLIPVYEHSIKSMNGMLNTVDGSPYYQSIDKTVTVAFIPYQNMDGVKDGTPVYSCSLKIILCQKSGVIRRIYDAEVYANHPVFKTPMKGRFVGVDFIDASSSEAEVVYIGKRPLFL